MRIDLKTRVHLDKHSMVENVVKINVLPISLIIFSVPISQFSYPNHFFSLY